MAKEKLTAAKAKNLGPGMYGDGSGLWLRVVTAERSAWLLRYSRHGKATGGYPNSFGEKPLPVTTRSN